MSMNSDIVKGVVGTSADGYQTFGDIKLYGGNVYKVANDGTTPAAVGRFCYVRPVGGVLTATKPYYTTSATTSPVKDEEASLLCNGYVLEEDSLTQELYIAMSGVLSISTVPETSSNSLAIVTGSSYYIDWGVEASPVDTVKTTEELVVNTFLGASGVSSLNYPVLKGSLQRVAYATSEKTVSLLFPQRDSDGETALFDSLTLAARFGSSVLRTSFRNDGVEGLIVDSDDDVQVRINTRDLGADASAKFRVRSGSSNSDAFVVMGDGDVEITKDLMVSNDADISGDLILDGSLTQVVKASLGIEVPNGQAIKCSTFEPSPSANDMELRAVNDLYFTLDSDDSGVGNLYMRRGVDNATFFEANENAVSKLVPEFTVNIDESSIQDWHLLAVNSNGLLAKSTDEAHDILNQHTFTGTHAYTSSVSIDIGDAVFLNQSLTLEKCSQASISNCVGLLQKVSLAAEDNPLTTSLGGVVTSGNVYYVAAVGDSIKGDLRGFKVCNEGGAISAGDLLVTSSTPGRLMKQADDIIRSSTVGKAMQDVTFNDSGEADDIYGFIYCG